MEAFRRYANTLQEYLRCIKEFQEKKNPSALNEITRELEAQGQLQTFFRGQTSTEYEWKPSVFRENRLENEARIYSRCITEFPAEFYGLNSIFDRLAKIQHYGSATRILDFTVCPLVALLFACEDDSKDGEVAIYRTTYTDEQELGVKCLAFLATYPRELNTAFFDRLREHLETNYSDETLQKVINQHYFVIPQITNERLRRQKGVFMAFGQKEGKQKTVSTLDENFGRGENYPGYIGYITIPAKQKKIILDELEHMSITKKYLMPDIEGAFKSITEGK